MLTTLQLEPCRAPLWAKRGHAQTILSFFLPKIKVELDYEKKILSLPDNDRLLLLYTAGQSDYVIYLFHGLTGHASVNYMERTAKICADDGHAVYRVNHRDCGEGAGLALHPYHSGRGEDISEVIALGRREHPDKKHIAIGFSLSGNALLTLLTGQRGTVLPDYAISVNAPIDLMASVAKIKKLSNKVYDWFFVQGLRRAIRLKYERGNLTQLPNISRFDTLSQVDSLYTAPASGFKSAEDYYQTCSTAQHLSKIHVPTILLTSKDDPFVPHEMYIKAKLSPSTYLHIEKTGGHMGYLSRKKTTLGNYHWMDYAIHTCLKTFTQQL